MGRVVQAALDDLGESVRLGGNRKAIVVSAPRAGAPVGGRFERSYRYTVVDTIGGGTSEIQRNIIARRGLDLPAG